ncbi:MAG TPA: endolytic transglycosylase MltG, partial [Terriglobia bacterium]|nr:endolytic transglycosylase MltG [Terriglobia bacterium]
LAALHPASTDYLYFVSNTRGGHQFARTLAEHQRNVAQYRKEAAALRHIEPDDAGTSQQRRHTSKAQRRQR